MKCQPHIIGSFLLLILAQQLMSQCNVNPSWDISPSNLNVSFNSSDFPQGTVCPGSDPIIDPIDSGIPTAIPNDPSFDCDLSQLNISYLDSYSSSDPANDCTITIQRQWKATYTQANGGTGNIDGIQEIQIVDDVPPILTCPSDITLAFLNGCDESDPNVESISGYSYGASNGLSGTQFEILTDGQAFDNCDTELEISFIDGPVTSYPGNCPSAFISWVRTWTITDNCGLMDQCDQLIEVFDSEVPVFTSNLPDFDENMMITACDVFDPNIELLSGYPFNDATSTNIDEPDFEALGGFVEDNCKAGYGINYSYLDVYFDLPGNCPGEIGQIFRVWTATDHCGNIEIDRQEIFLFDNLGPEITSCPSDVEIVVDSPASCDQNNPDIETVSGFPFSFSGTILDNISLFQGSAIDNCDGQNYAQVSYIDEVTQSACQSGSDVAFEIARTWILSDACGNETTCEQLIQLLDKQPPVLLLGADYFYNQDVINPSNPMYFETVACEQEVAWEDPVPADIFDNCESFDELVIWKSHQSPFLFREGTTEVTYVFRDNCGNQSEVTWEVTVVCVPCTPQNIYYLCTDPPTICDFSEVNTFSSCTPAPIGPEPLSYLCDDTEFIENPSYLRFVAGEESISIIYLVENCANDEGLQIAITDPCDPLACYLDDKLECVTGFGNVTASNLTVGNIYQIIVDGCNGDQCEYTISINTGPFLLPDFQSEPPAVSSLTSLSCHPDDFRFCVGQQVSLFPDGYEDAIYNFCWSIDNQNGVVALNDQPNCGQAVVGTQQGMNFSCSNDYSTCGPLEMQFNEVGTYKICLIEVENGCDHVDLTDYCWQITVVPSGPVDFGTFSVCQSEMPWFVDVLGPNGEAWPGPPMDEGQMTIVDTDYCGCTYEYMIEVKAISESQGEGDIRVCFEDRENWQDPLLDVDWEDIMNGYVPDAMGAEVFVDNGSSLVNYEGTYCDTMVFYNVYVYDVPGEIKTTPGPACDAILNFEIDTLLFPEFIDEDELDFTWFNNNEIVDVGPTISVDEEGIYILTIELEIDEWTTCTYEFVDTVTLNTQTLGEPTFVLAPSQTCPNALDGLIFSVPTSTQANYSWIVENGSFIPNISTDQISVDIDDPNLPLVVSVYSTSMCGQSPIATTELMVVDAPIIELLPLEDICIDEVANISSNLISGSVEDYYWFIDDTSAEWNMINSNTQSTIEVSWPTAGVKTFSLYVVDPGSCESEILTAQVNVLDVLSPPQVSCTETTSNSVTISWQDNILGDGTSVNVTSGQTGVQNGNEFIVENLTANEIVSFELSTLGQNHPCGNSVNVDIECEASACNLNPIIESPATEICLDENSIAIQLIETNGFPGGVWSGEGVSATGLFDPNSSGAGTFEIEYLVEDELLDCFTSTSLQIIVSERPVEEFFLSIDTVCIGELIEVDFKNTNGYQYEWEFDEGSSNPMISGSSFDLSYQSSGDKLIQLKISNGLNCEYEIALPVYVRPEFTFEGVVCVEQTTSSVEFGWPDEVGEYEITVSINGEILEIIISNENIYLVNDLSEGDLVEISVLAIDPNGCQNSIDIASCVSVACPDYEVVITAESQVECWNQMGVEIELSQVTYDENGIELSSSGTWESQYVDQNSGIFTAPGPGIYYVLYSYLDDESNCFYSNEIELSILEEPNAEFYLNQSIVCASDAITININGEYNQAVEFGWNLDLDPSMYLLEDNMDGSFTLEIFESGNYSIDLQAIVGDCVSEIFSQNILVEEPPVLPNIFCDSEINSILFSWDEVPCAEMYIVTIDDNPPITQTDNEVFIDGLNESQEVNIEIEVISNCVCPFDGLITINCSSRACEPAEIMYGNNIETSFCPNEIPEPFPLELSIEGANILGTGSFEWTSEYINQNGLVDLTGEIPGIYNIELSYVEEGCTYYSNIEFRIFEIPDVTIDIMNAPCPDSEFGLVNIFPEGSESFTLSIDGQEINPGQLELIPGSYELVLTNNDNCSFSEQFDVGAALPPSLEINGPGFIRTDSIGFFNVQFSEIADSLLWTINGEDLLFIDCSLSDCDELSYSASVPGEYELCLTNYYGQNCAETSCHYFVVSSIAISNVYIPNIFNPNSGNEENNTLNIYVTGFDVMIKEVNIYDRWGNVVHRNSSEMSVSSGEKALIWNGEFSGSDYLPGVYVYKVEISIDGIDDVLVGDISIID